MRVRECEVRRFGTDTVISSRAASAGRATRLGAIGRAIIGNARPQARSKSREQSHRSFLVSGPRNERHLEALESPEAQVRFPARRRRELDLVEAAEERA